MGCDSPEGLGFATDPAIWIVLRKPRLKSPFGQTRGPEAAGFPGSLMGLECRSSTDHGARCCSPVPGRTSPHGPAGPDTGTSGCKGATQTPSSLTQAR